MPNTPEPKIVDISVKEGGLKIHHRFLLDQVSDLAREVQRSGLSYAEVSHGVGIGGFRRGYPGLNHDKDLLNAARKSAPNLQYMVYLAAYPYSVTELELIHDLFSIGRVGINVHEIEAGKDHLQRLTDL